MTEHESRLAEWLSADATRMFALRIAATLDLHDWCIAAGFVRNLVWDRLHGHEEPTPLADVDLIYFDSTCADHGRDEELTAYLREKSPSYRWSVKNQARMHLRNGDAPYRSTADAMTYWPEVETAVGVRLDAQDRLEIVAPFGMASLFDLRITPNARRDSADFMQRVESKRWVTIWPGLRIRESG